MLGSIEAGGTKFVCAVSDLNLNLIDKVTIETTAPSKTLQQVFQFFTKYSIRSLGIGCFGPIDLDINSRTYGYITATPKLAWQNFNFVQTIKEQFNIPIAFNTDVNVAAYGEFKLGAAQTKNSCVYVTVGTGIGGGVVLNNKILSSKHHPEMGHIFVKRDAQDDFIGNCPFHKDCLEGMACGPAIEKRWNMKPINITDDHKAWDFEAFYLAQAVVNYTLTLAPDMIILGGGIMHKANLLDRIKATSLALLNGYFELGKIDDYLCSPKLGDNAGIIGGLLLAKEELNQA